jgi:hypothetical protein
MQQFLGLRLLKRYTNPSLIVVEFTNGTRNVNVVNIDKFVNSNSSGPKVTSLSMKAELVERG